MKHRLFIAIDLPDACVAQIVSLQDRLARLVLPVVWEKPEKLHLTLNFIGRVTHEQLALIKRLVKPVAASHPQFDLQFPHLETLYKRHENSLIYLSPAKNPALLSLQSSLTQVLTNATFPQPLRFLPHVTIGRLDRTDPPTTKAALDKVNGFPYHPLDGFPVDHLTLYESYVSKLGSHYQKLAPFMLQIEQEAFE